VFVRVTSKPSGSVWFGLISWEFASLRRISVRSDEGSETHSSGTTVHGLGCAQNLNPSFFHHNNVKSSVEGRACKNTRAILGPAAVREFHTTN
jgi:hypothetical protein